MSKTGKGSTAKDVLIVPSRAMMPLSQDRVERDALVDATRALARTRWRIAIILTLCMVGVYFGFILSVAFRPAALGRLLAPGLSLGIVLGALVIASAWLLTFAYVRWANRVYDPALAKLRSMSAASPTVGTGHRS